MRDRLPYGVTIGDSSGVGPEILLKAFAAGELTWPVVVFGDTEAMRFYNDHLRYGVSFAFDSICRWLSTELSEYHRSKNHRIERNYSGQAESKSRLCSPGIRHRGDSRGDCGRDCRDDHASHE